MDFYFIPCVVITTIIIYFVVQALATGSSYVFLTSPHPHLFYLFLALPYFPVPQDSLVTAWDSTTSPGSPGSLFWRTVCGQQELGARAAGLLPAAAAVGPALHTGRWMPTHTSMFCTLVKS